MMVHVDDVPLTHIAMVASVGFQRLQNTLKTLVLVPGKIWLTTVQQGNEAFVSFVNQTFEVIAHAFLIILVEVHFMVSGCSSYSFWVSWFSDPSF